MVGIVSGVCYNFRMNTVPFGFVPYGKSEREDLSEVTSMEEDMSKLFTFLENFDVENAVKIYDENDKLIFDGKVGDVPQRISNMMSVIRGTVMNEGAFIRIMVRKA